MLTYGTFADYARMKTVLEDDYDTTGERVISTYLRRATQLIDGTCRRTFFPLYDTHAFPLPTNFADLRRRAYPYEDLMLDNDLLEARYVQTGSAIPGESGETLASGIDEDDTTFTATDVDALDAAGIPRFSAGDILQIDNERMRVVSADTLTNVVTLERGVLQTEAAAHSSGATICKLALTLLSAGIDYSLIDLNINPKYAIRIQWPSAWGGFTYRTSTRQPQIFVDGFWGYHEDRRPWIDTLDTITTSGGINTTAVSFTVADGDGIDANGDIRFEAGMLIRAEQELMEVVSVATNTVTVRRAQRGTLAAAHAAGTKLRRWMVLPEISGACLSIAKTLRDADASVGGRQGVSEMSVGAKITMPADVNETLARLTRAIL